MTTAPLILVVDDEALVRLTLADFLMQSGFEVIEAEDADHALEILRDHPVIAALITDVRMPGSKNGFELARDVAASRHHIRIFIMSGHVGEADTTMPPGAIFVSKPFNHEKLIEDLKAALANDR